MNAYIRNTVLFHLSKGCTIKDVAVAMRAPKRTVDTWLEKIRWDLGANTTTEAVAIALREKMIE